MSQPPIINIPKILKDSLPAELSQLEVIGFPKYSKIFSPAEMSQPQIINIPKTLKVFFACRIVLVANHQYPENAQSLFRMQNCLSCKSSESRKYSKTYWPAELSQPHVICIPKIFEDFFDCRIVLAANHQYPENTQRLFARRIVLAANHHYPGNIQGLFRLQNCLCSKSLISRKYSKTFLACRIVLAANHQKSRKYSKTFWPAELSQPHVICIPKTFDDFFACRIVLAANHQYPGNIQRLFHLQNCLSCRSSVSRNIRRLLRLKKCLNRKSSISRIRSKSFSHAELSQPQIINIPKILKDLLAC